MAEPKTQPTKASVAKYLAAVRPEARRDECLAVAALMKKATRAEPVMWGPSIVGFGTRTIQYAGGRQADWPLMAFSPRAAALTLYVHRRFEGGEALVASLGKVKASAGCLYVKRLEDVDLGALRALLDASVKAVKAGG